MKVKDADFLKQLDEYVQSRLPSEERNVEFNKHVLSSLPEFAMQVERHRQAIANGPQESSSSSPILNSSEVSKN